MSLLPPKEQYENKHLRDGNDAPKVTETSVLLATAGRMIKTAMVDDYPDDARSKVHVIRWRVPSLLNNVTEDGYFNMVSAGLAGSKKTIENQQPNGNWEPCDYEVEIREGREKSPEIFLGVKWVDLNGADELEYHNGAPVMNINVKSNNEDNDVKALVKLLAKREIESNEAQEAPAEPETTPKKVSRKVKR
jgi:hypothetical protein